MIVAAGTTDRQPEQAATDDIDAIVEDVVDVVDEVAANGDEAEGGEMPVPLRRGELVGRQLGDDKLVVGEVFVEGPDDPVAVGVAPGMRLFLEEDVALVVGVAGQVEPMASPAFAIVGRLQQLLDHVGERLRSGTRVGLEAGDGVGLGGEPQQGE